MCIFAAQTVNEYLDTNNMSRVDKVKRGIIDLYIEDFGKIDPSGRAARLFQAIPSELSKNASRYQVSSVLGDSERKNLDEVLEKMRDSMTVNFAYHSDDPNVGLALNRRTSERRDQAGLGFPEREGGNVKRNCDMDQYKMFVGDTGLFVTLAFWDKDVTENVIYQKLLSDKLSANLGYVYENIVAQMLTAAGSKLFYHTWPTESGKHNYEVDFILSRGAKIWPLEVKSSGYKTHASIDAFCEKFSDRVSERFLVYTKDLRKDGATTLLPVMMTMFL